MPRHLVARLSLIVSWALFVPPVAAFGVVEHVIHVSVDGLRPDAITNHGAANVPNFYRMRTQGAFTDNARTDYDYTVTLPSHVTQLTGRPVVGAAGHNWTSNSDPAAGETLHTKKGSYVAGVCDVAHDNGLRTGVYASKTKFSLFDTSWNATNGASDATGPDNGRDKVDIYRYNSNTATLTNQFLADMAAAPFSYAFLHLTDPDTVGHSSGWWTSPTNTAYMNIIKVMDQRLGEIFNLIDTDARFRGNTVVIVTADHGGIAGDHSSASVRENYTIPFYVWGAGVAPGADLYALNRSVRLDPGTGRPTYAAPLQPIRNGEAANLALDLLGLGPVPGSSMNSLQDLVVPEPSCALLLLGGWLAVRRRG